MPDSKLRLLWKQIEGSVGPDFAILSIVLFTVFPRLCFLAYVYIQWVDELLGNKFVKERKT